MAAGPPARAQSIDQQLAGARADHRSKLVRLQALQQELGTLLGRYLRLERRAGHASLDLVGASRAVVAARLAAEAAQQRLDDRIRTAYELGPGGILDALLSSETFADLATAQEFTARTIGVDARTLELSEAAAAELHSREQAAARARRALAPRQRKLAALLAELRAKVDETQRLADRAGVVVSSLEEQRQAILDASAREIGRNLLAGGATGADQSALLALLGPTGGRTCETPTGLMDTGKRFGGDASWYGWEFAGQSTANGAIFDPALFTAANRWLPFGTFLKVHHQDRCAIVLVNDRGPYGHEERVIDLSMAAAKYLGVGVAPVTADILIPRDGLPA
ncbi:MAG TPA: septal ring lytic transglycosylase RlpA family protein [Actinomycetota bacterium]